MKSPPAFDPASPEFAPALACTVLVAALAAQFLLPSNLALTEASPLAPRRARPLQVAAIADYPAILQAPLFAPDRTPRGDGAADAGGAGFSLVGLAAGRGFAVAVVKGPDGKAHSLSPGRDLLGWQFIGVDHGRAAFKRSGERMILSPGGGQPPATHPDNGESQ